MTQRRLSLGALKDIVIYDDADAELPAMSSDDPAISGGAPVALVADGTTDSSGKFIFKLLELLGGGNAAPADASYITLGLNSSLGNERVLTGTADQIILTDGGANTTITLSTPQDIDVGAFVQFARLGIGVVPAVEFEILDNGAAATTIQTTYRNSTVMNVTNFRGARGSLASPLKAEPGDVVGRFNWAGHDGGDFNPVLAQIRAVVDGTTATNVMPGRIELLTTPDSSQTPQLRVTIDRTGLVAIVNDLSVGGDTVLAGDLDVEGGRLKVGLADTTVGVIECFSSSGSSGGFIAFHLGATVDTETARWEVGSEAVTGAFFIRSIAGTSPTENLMSADRVTHDITLKNGLFLPDLKTTSASAATNEIWVDTTAGNVLKRK